jgi:hypothetical protein
MTEKDDAFLERIKGFVVERDELDQKGMGEIIRLAEECIFGSPSASGENESEKKEVNGVAKGKTEKKTKTLCDATLRIERSGPDEMHWTIVDLPGLIRSGRGGSTTSASASGNGGPVTNGDAPSAMNALVAEDIVRRRLRNERSIVL